jgi:hypothetical protein
MEFIGPPGNTVVQSKNINTFIKLAEQEPIPVLIKLYIIYYI